MRNRYALGWVGVLATVAAAVLVGCEKKGAAPADAAGPVAAESVTEAAAVGDDVLAKLAAADALDGAEDKIVSKCGSCELAMDGGADNALKVGEYTMHFCTDKCKAAFEKDPSKAILLMEIPDG